MLLVVPRAAVVGPPIVAVRVGAIADVMLDEPTGLVAPPASGGRGGRERKDRGPHTRRPSGDGGANQNTLTLRQHCRAADLMELWDRLYFRWAPVVRAVGAAT